MAESNKPKHEEIAKIVADLPVSEPDLEWRSQLNEKLLKAGRRKAPRRWVWVSGSLGLAAACAMAWVWMAKAPVPENGLESEILAVHRQSVGWGDMVGPGLAAGEQEAAPDEVDWTPADLEVL